MKKIAILGSTGSIGIETLKIINQNQKKFNVILLSTNNNASKLFKQAKKFKVKCYNYKLPKIFIVEKKFLDNKIKIYYNFTSYEKIF